MRRNYLTYKMVHSVMMLLHGTFKYILINFVNCKHLSGWQKSMLIGVGNLLGMKIFWWNFGHMLFYNELKILIVTMQIWETWKCIAVFHLVYSVKYKNSMCPGIDFPVISSRRLAPGIRAVAVQYSVKGWYFCKCQMVLNCNKVRTWW